MAYRVIAGRVFELTFQTGGAYADPFNQVEVDVVFTGPDGAEQRVPAFWGGGAAWRVRFSARLPGFYRYVTRCSNPEDGGLEGQRGEVQVLPSQPDEPNPLLAHGPLRVCADHTGFEHADGTPFFWLGDTWWLGLGGRLGWPEEFQHLVADRKQKGFNVAHLVAGLYPDMAVDDPRNGNLGGPSWESDFTRINPAFYDQADLKLQYMVEQGIAPLIVGAWGYYLPVLGIEKMKRHWRYLVARWGAYPVIWCLAGEVTMPYYMTRNREDDIRMQRAGWSELGRYVKMIDPFHRPLSAHSCAFSDSERELDDPSCLDFNFFQTAHGNQQAALSAARHARELAENAALRPLVNAETCYEGILGTAWQDVQRFCFWSSVLSGAVGYSYGANGIWQINRPGDPYGPSPHGMTWGNLPWEEAMRLPGSGQVGLGANLLRELPFERLEAHPEWVEPHASAEDWFKPYCAGILGELYVVYFPAPLAPWVQPRPRVLGLNPGSSYRAFFFDPASGERQPVGEVHPDADGSLPVPMPGLGADMVLVVIRL